MVKMKYFVSVVLLLTLWTVSSGDENNKKAVPANAVNAQDVQRIKSVLSKGFELSDPLSASYAVLSYATLKIEVQKSADVCKFLLSSLDSLDGSKVEPVFATANAASKLPSCKVPALKPAVKQALEKLVKEGGSIQDIFYAGEALKATGVAVDAVKLAEVLKAAIKADDSPQSLGYALWASASNFKAGQKLEIWERIEDVVAQADEVDKQYLQFEGGLSVTAAVINGIVRLSEASNKPLPLSQDQVVKFGNYLVSRKTVTTPRGVYLFASSLDVLSRNKFAVPVYVGLAGSNVLTDANKVLAIRGSDLLGRPLDISIQLESVTYSADGKKVPALEFIQAVPDKTDKTLYVIDLKTKPLPKGFFNVVLVPKSTKNEKALILQANTVEVKQVGKLGAVTARVGVQDLDQQSHTSWSDLNKGQKLATKLELEPAQKLVVKVAASDSLHQVFVLLRNKESQKEVAFIAQPETAGKTDYKLELDLSANAKDLNYQSGVYEVVLYLGDFLIEDSLEWNLGEVTLNVLAGKAKTINPLYGVAYGPKPEIKHLFRTPEPRPPRVVSDAFTVIALAPILILLVLWVKIGVNINGFSLSLSALGFHLGLFGLFGVYTTFWLKLTMFEALKCMIIPGVVTFLAGNRLLSHISEQRTKAI